MICTMDQICTVLYSVICGAVGVGERRDMEREFKSSLCYMNCDSTQVAQKMATYSVSQKEIVTASFYFFLQ